MALLRREKFPFIVSIPYEKTQESTPPTDAVLITTVVQSCFR